VKRSSLPLPQGAARVGPDASARTEILAGLRSGILALGQPGGIDPEALRGHRDELNAE